MAPELRLALLQARQAEASEAHRILTAPDALRVSVPEKHLRARFDEQGAELTSDQDVKVQARLTLTSLGRSGGTRQRVKAAKPVAGEHTVAWEHPVGGARVEESWQAGPLGLEHRVVVRERPSGEGTVELEVSVAGLTAEPDGEDVKLRSASGGLEMREYFVRDARGKLLVGAMRVRGESVVYGYEDAGAEYPVEVDPLVGVQQEKLLADDKAEGDLFGSSVALSDDGNTALVGAVFEDDGATNGNGAAYVFTRTDGVWTQQQKLLADDKASKDQFGSSVALSGDGNTALVGADGATKNNGAAYVFTRTAGVWAQQAKLLADDKANFDNFGFSVALSGDGNTALVGAYFESDGATNNGAAYVFNRTDGVWTQQQKLLADDKASSDFFGWSVALSDDGNTALVGADAEDTAPTTANGAAYVFARTAGVWTQQAKLLADDKKSGDTFGKSVALSGDGNTALVGARLEDDGATENNGAAYVFTRTDGVWTQQAKLLADDKAEGDQFGFSVALSGDGNTALVGAVLEDDGATENNGAAYVFTRTDGVWAQQQKLLGDDKESGDNFGTSVALSGDGNTALLGANEESDGATNDGGAAYVFEVGQTCSSNDECPSGFCTNGICCNSACGGGASGAGGDGSAGESGAGGESGSSGQSGKGGSAGKGGSSGKGGAAGKGGSAGKGGKGGSAGQGDSAGAAGDGGSGAGGATGGSTSGASGQSTGGQAGGGTPANDTVQDQEGGCGCRMTGGGREGGAWAAGLLACALLARRRRAA